MTIARSKKPHNVGWFNKEGKIFYGLLIALPILQFCIFYIGVNFNSILLAFQSYTNFGGIEKSEWVGFQNFQEIWKILTTDPDNTLLVCLKNTFYFFLIDAFVIMPLSLLFGYYIYKKAFLANFFKVMLFLPSVICSMVFVIFYNYFVEGVIPQLVNAFNSENPIYTIFGDPNGLAMLALIIFYIWINFSGSILLYLNAMSSIPTSTIEAAKIDGANEFEIFLNVIIPGCWKTIVSLFIIACASTASNQAFLFSFYGGNAPGSLQTLGYYQFMIVIASGQENPISYPMASAYGVLLTLIIAPLTFLLRYLMNRFGPSED
ncbi:MAG TPA: hypothetical protein DCZ41_02015 [Firmicutes bacterium]|nr:hypothetical protein [Bacillota bacterium]